METNTITEINAIFLPTNGAWITKGVQMKVDSFQKYLKSWTTGEGNGNPLQYSCLENPMDGGAC